MSDRLLCFSSGKTARSGEYRRCAGTWDRFVEALRLDAPATRKDCGNIVGGLFTDDYRLRANVEFRSMLTLDADDVALGWALDAALELGCDAVFYTTWSHTAEAQRWRLFAPLSRDVSPDEYWFIAHAVMRDLGGFKDTGGAEAERLMHLPSTQGDGSYRHFTVAGDPLDADTWLARAAAIGVPARTAQAERWSGDSDGWLASLPAADAPMCRVMEDYVDRLVEALEPAGERHVTVCRALLRMVGAAEAGHQGISEALERAEGALLAHRDLSDPGEFSRMVEGAVAKVAAEPTPGPRLCCGSVRDWNVQPVSSLGAVSGVLVEAGLGTEWRTKPPSEPDAVARDLLDRLWTISTEHDGKKDTCLVLRHWLGDTYEWHITHWERMPAGHLEAVIQKELRTAVYRKEVNREWRYVPWNPTQRSISGVATMLQGDLTLVHAKTGANHWIDCTNGRCPVGDVGRRYLSFQNCILDLDTSETYEHVSAFFNTWSMRFDYDPAATAPLWERTLEQWFPNDAEARDTLEEVLGHLVLGGMEYDKFFVFLGDQRSGKGTVMRVLNAMIGPAFTTQSFDDLADRFGQEDLLGKTVCHISEAAATNGMRRVVSLVKSITGQDEGRSVKRKGQKSVDSVDHTVRFVLTGNDELALPDDSSVIVDRMIVLPFMQSFLGRENIGLTGQLVAEGSGIFNRLRIAHQRLTARGYLVQPASGEAMKERLRASASPMKAWWSTCFEVTGDPSDSVDMDDVVASYRAHVDTRVGERGAQMAIKRLLPAGVTEARITGGIGQRVRILRGLRQMDD